MIKMQLTYLGTFPSSKCVTSYHSVKENSSHPVVTRNGRGSALNIALLYSLLCMEAPYSLMALIVCT